MSDQDPFSEGEEPTAWDTDSDGSTAHGQTHPFNARHPLSYKQYKQQQHDFPGFRKVTVLQTSDSSDSEAEDQRMLHSVNREKTKTNSATEFDNYPSKLQFAGKGTRIVTSKFAPARKILHPLNSDSKKASTPPCQQSSTELQDIHTALLHQTELMKGLLKQMERCENRMESVENKFGSGPTSSSSCSTPSRKRRVPEEVRVSSERVSN